MSLPVDILVTEHKLILQAIDRFNIEIEKIRTAGAVNQNFITIVIDFFRTYADRFHHGKEEGILFKALSQKKLDESDHKVMTELILEHAFARRTVTALEGAKERLNSGDKEALKDVLESLAATIKLYPLHIEKEDNHFFYPSMKYFSEAEQQNMMVSFLSFNQDFTDKRYKQIIVSLT